EWARAVGGNQLECGNWDGIRVSEDGGILFGGKTLTYGAGEYDLFLFKLTQNGDLVWSRAAGSPGDDACWTLTPTRDGGCIAGGKLHDASDVESAQAADAVLMKLDAAGGLEWTSVVGDSLFQEIEEIIETTGGYAIAGTHSFGSGQGDFLVAATDATGRVPGCGWSRTAEPAFSSIEPRCAETAMTVQDVTDRIRVSDFIAESSIPNLRADIPCASGTSVRSGGKRSPGPSTFFFEPVFPNPFNPAARIHYRLEKTSRVRLDVMDIRGRRVAVLRDGTEQPGPHTALFTAEGAVSGTFLFRLNVDGKVSVQKAVLSR
ncbi:MAG: hypothetical protein QUS35_00455, partial [bacterium]|nr:hypothetical protein [bacterium]